MAFSQTTQVFFVDRFYHHLKERFPQQAYYATLTAFHRYALQIGVHAAQRAVRDGQTLNFETYKKYREIVPDAQIRKTDRPNIGESIITKDVYIGTTTECVCVDYMNEVNSPVEVHKIFCGFIDSQECCGFNPEITYILDSTHYNAPACIHRVPNPGLDDSYDPSARMSDVPPYAYAVANEYYTMKETIVAIFGQAGEEICKQVEADFIARYGAAEWAEVEQYKNANFDIFYPKSLE